MKYVDFLSSRRHSDDMFGISPTFFPDCMFDFQADITDWAVRKGRGAIFADCGLGKTLMELVWAENIHRSTNKNVLLITCLAVTPQIITESEKFGIKASRSTDGSVYKGITVTNYEKLHLFNSSDFVGVVCDESSILKNFDGQRKKIITDFMRKMPYRLLASATPAPNDFTELGTSSECLGDLGYIDMLNRYFKNTQNNSARGRIQGEVIKWRFKGHAEEAFWRWVCSWARAFRKPSDLGYENAGFDLLGYTSSEHIVEKLTKSEDSLFELPVIGLQEQRRERRETIKERCEKVSDLVNGTGHPAITWCHMNDEGDLLEKLIPDGVQISGKDSDDRKESKFMDFLSGNARVLITKPSIGAWGLNFQHCNHMTFFPSHSFEQYYQALRRCLRFGQKSVVHVDIVATSGERGVLNNLRKKEDASNDMFDKLISKMNNPEQLNKIKPFSTTQEVPSWL